MVLPPVSMKQNDMACPCDAAYLHRVFFMSRLMSPLSSHPPSVCLLVQLLWPARVPGARRLLWDPLGCLGDRQTGAPSVRDAIGDLPGQLATGRRGRWLCGNVQTNTAGPGGRTRPADRIDRLPSSATGADFGGFHRSVFRVSGLQGLTGVPGIASPGVVT